MFENFLKYFTKFKKPKPTNYQRLYNFGQPKKSKNHQRVI